MKFNIGDWVKDADGVVAQIERLYDDWHNVQWYWVRFLDRKPDALFIDEFPNNGTHDAWPEPGMELTNIS